MSALEDNLLSRREIVGKISRNERLRKINVKHGKFAYANLMNMASDHKLFEKQPEKKTKTKIETGSRVHH